MDKRPPLTKNISLNDFKEFYWLKKELTDFCQSIQLSRSGGKIEIANRIEHFLKTGEKPSSIKKKISKAISGFDWNKEELSLETVITDSYKNTTKVRDFFTKEIGKHFKFNVKFMNWMKANKGKTLAEAKMAWKEINAAIKANKSPKDIAPQFEYNIYLRDFLEDNPDKSRKVGISLWKIKRSLRGDNKYQRSDLSFLNE